MRPIVKICGITNIADAEEAIGLGADEIGFIFAPSPRRISPEDAASIVSWLGGRGLLKRARTVGVFVNEDAAAMAHIATSVGLDAVQIHGDEAPERCANFSFPWYRALRIGTTEEAVARCSQAWTCSRLLVDTAAAASREGPAVYGGTGIRLATEAALAAARAARRAGKEFFLAGGITPENVAALVAAISPDGIDLSSGVEERPGKKSPLKLQRLFAELGS